MDDFLIYLRAKFLADAELRNLFAAAGVAGVECVAPGGRATSAYPRIILDGDEGDQESFGDNAPPKFFNGQVRIEIVTRETEGRPDPDAQLAAIRLRCVQIALGSGLTATVKGVVFTGASGAKWSVTRLAQIRPTGSLPVVDPVFCRHRTTLAVSLNRTQ